VLIENPSSELREIVPEEVLEEQIAHAAAACSWTV